MSINHIFREHELTTQKHSTMADIPVLDVTTIAPQFKHSTIYDMFDALNVGEAFIIHNDHDPVPLFFSLKNDRGDTFGWDYVEKGPKVWEVKITKTE